MKKPKYSFLPADTEGFDSLMELTLDMRWSWDHGADEIWRILDPALWDLTHNPWVVLQTVSRNQFQTVMNNPVFRNKGEELIDRLNTLEQGWDSMRFGDVKVETLEKQHKFEVQIYFNKLDPDTVQIELFANGTDGHPPIMQKMARGSKLEGTANGYNYFTSVSSTRPALDYTPRAIPCLPNVSVPLEISRILWQR